MRHPTTGPNEDDLSRLTGSSSSASTASCGSAASLSTTSPTQDHLDIIEAKQQQHLVNPAFHVVQSPEKTPPAAMASKLQGKNSLNSSQHGIGLLASTPRFSSTYLPEIINPMDWQKSRKRKERLDSNSAASQDRKLQRSNSEELLTEATANTNATRGLPSKANAESAQQASKANCEVIRRVFSEDFKRTASYAIYRQEFERETAAEPGIDAGLENNAALANLRQSANAHGAELQPSSTPLSTPPNTGEVTKDLSRRVRHETSPARSHRHSPLAGGVGNSNGNGHGRHRDSDDSDCEHERRRSTERFCKSRQPPVRKYERRGYSTGHSRKQQATTAGNDHNDNKLLGDIQPTIAVLPTSVAKPVTMKAPHRSNVDLTSAQESLPWERGANVSDEPAPMLSRRYAHMRHHVDDNIDAAAKLAKAMPYPQQQPKQAATMQLRGEEMDCLEPIDTVRVRAFSSLENMRTRDVMQQVLPAMMAFQSPEERLKVINRRVTALKKKLVQLEDALEQRLGYRPSQAERLNDKYIKHALAELSKLRKERHELKTDPITALGLKIGVGGNIGAAVQDAARKLEKMKLTLNEIEQNLNEKRVHSQRSELLDELTADQLVQEKSAVQHGLLFFESLYGRPITKEERDAARPLYERYRQLKRLVSRTVMFGFGGNAGITELPTILEHEAMVFEATPYQYSSNNSTETTNSPSDSAAPNALTVNASSDESTTTTTTSNTAPAESSENLAVLSLDKLWEQLERVREEKTVLKATIREYESVFEEQNGRKMLKNDRKLLETETYAQYKEKKAKVRLLQALIKKQIGH